MLIVLALLLLIGLVVAGLGLMAAKRLTRNSTAVYPDIVAHFERGSIGADEGSGMPYWVWQALPRLFPEAFDGRLDYRAFGFLYRTDDKGHQEDLPIGISKAIPGRRSRLVQLRDLPHRDLSPVRRHRTGCGAGMPANNLDLYAFIRFVLEAAADERLNAEILFPAMEQAGASFGFERKLWEYLVIPRTREGLIERRSRLIEFIAGASPGGRDESIPSIHTNSTR